MSAPVIELEGVGKRYRLGEHHGRGTDLARRSGASPGACAAGRRAASRHLVAARYLVHGRPRAAARHHRANGAGKSTLLKIISNITTPTEGRCRTRGRIGSLLEVGTGFHGELTGLENTYLNGAILGHEPARGDRRLDEIVEFAGLERFMDTPVKRYSSGHVPAARLRHRRPPRSGDPGRRRGARGR